MFIQMILRGMGGISDDDARNIVRRDGILCNWWRSVHAITPAAVQQKLIERNLIWHLNHYNDIDPQTTLPFRENTPFISTTAGTVEIDHFNAQNLIFPPFLTALQFATNWFRQDGYLFYGYVFTLGKMSIELQSFSEDVRDLHLYHMTYFPYHHEGEVLAKIHIPVINLQKVEKYDGPAALIDFTNGIIPSPVWSETNPAYAEPDRFSNIRPFVL